MILIFDPPLKDITAEVTNEIGFEVMAHRLDFLVFVVTAK
jgi:hypothetical protein